MYTYTKIRLLDPFINPLKFVSIKFTTTIQHTVQYIPDEATMCVLQYAGIFIEFIVPIIVMNPVLVILVPTYIQQGKSTTQINPTCRLVPLR